MRVRRPDGRARVRGQETTRTAEGEVSRVCVQNSQAQCNKSARSADDPSRQMVSQKPTFAVFLGEFDPFRQFSWVGGEGWRGRNMLDVPVVLALRQLHALAERPLFRC
jgi:hypothetical protein